MVLSTAAEEEETSVLRAAEETARIVAVAAIQVDGRRKVAEAMEVADHRMPVLSSAGNAPRKSLFGTTDTGSTMASGTGTGTAPPALGAAAGQEASKAGSTATGTARAGEAATTRRWSRPCTTRRWFRT